MKDRNSILFWIVLGAISVAWIGFDHAYEGDVTRHFIMELGGAFLAFCVAVMAFNASLSRREGFSPYICAAFLAAGTIDLLHALVSVEILVIPASAMDRFIPGTWTAGRVALGVILLYGLIRTFRDPKHRPSSVRLALCTSLLSVLGVVLFALVPLPTFITDAVSFIHRPWELLALAIYAACVRMILRLNEECGIHRLVLPSLVLGMIVQVLMCVSGALFNQAFDASHVLKDVSYLALLVPLILWTWRGSRRWIEVASARTLSACAILLIGVSLIAVGTLATYEKAESRRLIELGELRFAEELRGSVWSLRTPFNAHLSAGDLESRNAFEQQWDRFKELVFSEDTGKIEREHAIQLQGMAQRLNSAVEHSLEYARPSHGAEAGQVSDVLDEVTEGLLKELDFVILAEAEEIARAEYEAMGQVHRLLLGQLAFLFIGLPVVLLLAARQLRRHARPIMELQEVAERVRSGETTMRANIRSPDEIGDLGETFNFMLDTLDERQAALLDSEESLRSLFDNTGDLIHTLASDGRVLSVNEAWRKALGYDDDEVTKLTVPDFIHPDSLPHCMANFERLLAGGLVPDAEAIFITKDGRKIHVVGSSTLHRIEGAASSIRSIFHDVTDRVRAEEQLKDAQRHLEDRVKERTNQLGQVAKDLRESERKLTTLLGNLPGMAYRCRNDANWTMGFVSEGCLDLTGYEASDLVGSKTVAFNDLIQPEDRAEVWRHVQEAIGKRNPYEIVYRIRDASGREKWVWEQGAGVYDDDDALLALEGLIIDISERKQFESELQQERGRLAQAVEERTRELQDSLASLSEANLSLQEANRHKAQFLSSMSHELRTPLNGVLGFTELLGGQFFGPLNEKQVGYVHEIDCSGKHLLALINDLLETAKIDAGAMEITPEEFPPGEAINAAVAMTQVQLRSKRLTVEVVCDPSVEGVYADPRRFKQILLNLISNALKYTPESGRIEIRTTRQANRVKIEVHDTGIGIELDDCGRIFSEFQQADPVRDELLGGIGLGLALTRRLVELHGGDIGVESQPGQGSTFWFTLPEPPNVSAKPPSIDAKSPTTEPTARGRRILVAEDNETNLSLIIDMLSIHGHHVVVARNGIEAVDLAQSSSPELILMDMRMPLMNGLEATKRIRTLPNLADVPIIALTASTGTDEQDVQIASGCDEHLAKPIQSDRLFEVLGKYLKHEANGNTPALASTSRRQAPG